MRARTKRKLEFYLSLVGIVALTLAIGVYFVYVEHLAWQMKIGVSHVAYEVFAAMAAFLFVMCIADIYLFFHLIMKRKY